MEACIEAIRRIPEMHAVIHENYRRGLVRRFPYAVFYEQWRGCYDTYMAYFIPLAIPVYGVHAFLERLTFF